MEDKTFEFVVRCYSNEAVAEVLNMAIQNAATELGLEIIATMKEVPNESENGENS